MSVPSPDSEAAAPAPLPEPLPKLDATAVFAALANANRLIVLKQLADGRKLSITDGAELTGCTRENMGKQMQVLWNAGLVTCEYGEDRRQSIYSIPARFRQTPGVLDYGLCQIDLKQL
ncbi:MAG: hypothetical protein RLY20_2062 [Verrucomicrobiota bacterium]